MTNENRSDELTKTIQDALIQNISGRTIRINDKSGKINAIDGAVWYFTVSKKLNKEGYSVEFGPPTKMIKRTLHDESTIKKLIGEMLVSINETVQAEKDQQILLEKVSARREMGDRLETAFGDESGMYFIYDPYSNKMVKIEIRAELSEEALVEILSLIKSKVNG